MVPLPGSPAFVVTVQMPTASQTTETQVKYVVEYEAGLSPRCRKRRCRLVSVLPPQPNSGSQCPLAAAGPVTDVPPGLEILRPKAGSGQPSF